MLTKRVRKTYLDRSMQDVDYVRQFKNLIIQIVISVLVLASFLYVIDAKVCEGRYEGDPEAKCVQIFPR